MEERVRLNHILKIKHLRILSFIMLVLLFARILDNPTHHFSISNFQDNTYSEHV